jgi:hypothetical protein
MGLPSPFNQRLICITVATGLAVVQLHSHAAGPSHIVGVDRGHDQTLAQRDPAEFVRAALAHCNSTIRDYTCRLTKQEYIDGHLRDPLQLRVLTRHEPFSVLMKIEGRARSIRQALYIEGRHADESGRPCIVVEPTGLNRLFVSSAEIRIDDERILSNNRLTIEQFGFQKALQRFAMDSAAAAAAGDLDLQYSGTGIIDGRPTFILSRRLPYSPGGRYPDALSVMHFDQEWLVPTSMTSYADLAGRQLLGSYIVTKVRLNPGLTESEFKL